jgi:hypothetical protein
MPDTLNQSPGFAADSVFRFTDSLSEQEVQAPAVPPVVLFPRHELAVRHENPLPLNHATPDWIFPVLLSTLAMFTFLRIFYARYFSRLFSAFANSNMANQVVRDENLLIQRASVLLNIVFYMVAALFLYFLSSVRHWEMEGLDYGFSRFLFFTILVAAVYSFKLIILKACGYIFGLDREMAAYIFNIFLVNSILGMALLPLTGLLAFASWIPITWITGAALAVIAAAFVYRLFRGVLIAMSTPSFSPVYLILYLCALEIAPLLVVLKLAALAS